MPRKHRPGAARRGRDRSGKRNPDLNDRQTGLNAVFHIKRIFRAFSLLLAKRHQPGLRNGRKRHFISSQNGVKKKH